MEDYKPKQLKLKLPEDVYKIILQEQGKLKEKCNCQKSQETTIYSILRRWADDRLAQR